MILKELLKIWCCPHVPGTPALTETETFRPRKKNLEAAVWWSSRLARMVTVVTNTSVGDNHHIHTLVEGQDPQPMKHFGRKKVLNCWPYMTTDQIWLGYKWSPAGGQIEPVLLRAVGLQWGTLPVGQDAAHGNSCRLSASPYWWVIAHFESSF